MKKIYLLTAILLLSGISYGQNFLNHKSFNSQIENYIQNHKKVAKNTSIAQPLTNKKQLDSLVLNLYLGNTSMRYAKEYFIYDAQGNVISNVSDDYDSNTKHKQEYTYDANNRLIEYELSQWDSINNQWYEQLKNITSYSSNYYTTENNTWNSTLNQWEKQSKTECFFNQNALDTLALTYIWNNQWELVSRRRINYNSNNDIILVINERSNGGTWENDNKTEYTYDANNNLIKELRYQWDTQNNNYYFDAKTSYGYDNQNRRVYSVYGSYDLYTSSWDYWDSTYQYYAPNSDIDSTMDFTYSASNTWQPDLKSKMEYNNNYTLSELILPPMFSDDDLYLFNHMLTKMTGFEYDNGQWPKLFDYNIYYSDFVGTGINSSAKNNTISIAPNPANDFFQINMDNQQIIDIHIYDVNGRMVKSLRVNSNTRINIQDIDSGIYFIQTIDNNQDVQIRKLIKE